MAVIKSRADRATGTYLNAGRNSIYRLLSEVGPEMFSSAVLDYAESSRIADISSIQKVMDLKKSARGHAISSPELATALTLVNSNIAAYWESIRLFPPEFHSHGCTVVPDFMSNVSVNGRNLSVEYHSFAVKLVGVKDKFHEESLTHDLKKRKESYSGSGLVVVIASDMRPGALFNATHIDAMSFCDYYISVLDRNVVDKSGTSHIPAEGFTNERKSFNNNFSSVFQRDISKSSINLGNYHVLLSHVLLGITRDTSTVRYHGDAFRSAMYDYLRLRMWPRVLEGPPAPPAPVRW